MYDNESCPISCGRCGDQHDRVQCCDVCNLSEGNCPGCGERLGHFHVECLKCQMRLTT